MPAIDTGVRRIEVAKMIGMTPEVLSFSGIWEDSPPYIRLPTWRLGYCTMIRSCARSKNTMRATTPIAKTRKAMMNSADSAPVRTRTSTWATAVGKEATRPPKMIKMGKASGRERVVKPVLYMGVDSYVKKIYTTHIVH